MNLGQLNGFDPGSEISPETLAEAGVIKSQRKPVKVLGEGALDHPLAVKAHKFSASAREKILAAGGSIEQLTL